MRNVVNLFTFSFRFTRVAQQHTTRSDSSVRFTHLISTQFSFDNHWLLIDVLVSFLAYTISICRDEVLSKNKYLEDEARRKAESVEREKNELNRARKIASSSSSIASNIGETQEAQDDDIFYDSDAEKQPEEWVSSFAFWLIRISHLASLLIVICHVYLHVVISNLATASRAQWLNPSFYADQITKHIHHYVVSITTIASMPHK